MLKKQQIPTEFKCRSHYTEVSNLALIYGICIPKSRNSYCGNSHNLTSFNKQRKKKSNKSLTHPSCTFKVASSFNLWINSLLPVKKNTHYILY